jgi:Zn-finger nucleic acid-binding protein
MDAGTLNCPECGAAVSADSTRCQYCNAWLQTVACPRCLKMMFAGSKYCPHCGALTEGLAVGRDSGHMCPRCQVKLTDVQVADTPLEECTRCGGAWVDVSKFEHICETADLQQVSTGLQLPPPVEIDANVHYLPCPQCGKLMSRMNYAGRSGIIIGVCRSHGIWLDRDEMRRIIEFIRSGGLQRAREIEKQELEEARRTASFEPLETGGLNMIPFAPFHESLSSDDRVHLLRGVASLANHFLGEEGKT